MSSLGFEFQFQQLDRASKLGKLKQLIFAWLDGLCKAQFMRIRSGITRLRHAIRLTLSFSRRHQVQKPQTRAHRLPLSGLLARQHHAREIALRIDGDRRTRITRSTHRRRVIFSLR